jgi:hypothetical protein
MNINPWETAIFHMVPRKVQLAILYRFSDFFSRKMNKLHLCTLSILNISKFNYELEQNNTFYLFDNF